MRLLNPKAGFTTKNAFRLTMVAAAIIVTGLFAADLSGASSAEAKSTPDMDTVRVRGQVINVSYEDNAPQRGSVVWFDAPLPDGRTITCVKGTGNRGGLSCWDKDGVPVSGGQ